MNKQKLQEQINTMREELAKMETELAKSENIELRYDGISFNLKVGDGKIDGSTSKATDWKEAGLIRETKELAEIASKNMVTRNKLEAYAHQIDPEWRESDNCAVYSIYRRVKDNRYIPDEFTFGRQLGTVYMSKSAAETICEWLNDGRIEL